MLRRVLVPFGIEFQKLQPRFEQAKGKAETKRLLATAQMELDAAISDLNEINPPEEVTDPHDRILAAFNDLAVRFGDVNDALSNGSKQEVRSTALDLEDAGMDFQRELLRADKELRELGIDPGEGPGTPT